jgi:phosphohistidine phosphatase
MKTLTVIRHAKAALQRPDQADFERTLSRRGTEDVSRMAERLAGMGLATDIFCSSPAARAKATAGPIAKAIGYPPAGIVWLPDLYLASSDELLRLVGNLPATADRAILVGHNPGLTDLVNRLAGAVIENLPTGAAATLRLSTDSWHTVRTGTATLAAFQTPANFRLPEYGS